MNELQQRIFSQETKNTQVSHADRRREPRTRNARPVYVRSAESSDVRFEEVRTMTDFSRSGFYFITARIESYRKGMQLYVIPAFSCFNFEYLGEVVRIDQLPFGECGIAVRLIRLGNPVVDGQTVAKSAFQSFARVKYIPPAMPQQHSES
jgi:hypothetical protein